MTELREKKFNVPHDRMYSLDLNDQRDRAGGSADGIYPPLFEKFSVT